MKIIIALILFSFSPTLVFSKNIGELKINGISIGDQLSDHYTIEEIKNGISIDYEYKDSQFRGLEIIKKFNRKLDKNDLFLDDFTNQLSFSVNKKNIIFDIGAGKFGYKSKEECISEKNKIEIILDNKFLDAEKYSYESPYYNLDEGKSIAYVTDYYLDDGDVRLFCVQWSTQVEIEYGFTDNLQVKVSSHEFLNWLGQ